MNTRLKFHAIAIASIIVVVTALYSVIGTPKTSVSAADTSGKAIEIYSATWGEQCNAFITETLAARARKPAIQNDSGAILPAETLTLVSPNNVLETVSAACNGKTACTLRAAVETLGIEPASACFKNLVVSYRCYRFDRLTTLDIGQGELLSIDCLQENAADAAHTDAR